MDQVMEVDPQDNHGSGGPSSVIVVYIMDPLGYEGSFFLLYQIGS